MRPVISLVYFDAGGGHRAAAQAIRQVIDAQRRPWDVRLVHLVDVLDPQSRFRRLMGFDPEDLYNRRLARGWTLGLGHELKLLQAAIRLGHAQIVRLLQQHWAATEPDLVVSLIPNFNRALQASVARTMPGVPFVTILTDLADLPPRFWIEAAQPQHIVCGSARAVAQARAAGHPAERIHDVGGMVLRPGFYRAETGDRALARRALGLPADEPVGLVLFGGQGSMQMLEIARQLQDRPLILMCGRNEALAERLRAQPAAARHVVVGFTDEVPRWMSLADYFIGKPGPGSLSEAVHMGLPVITFRNSRTMPQERYNCDWVEDGGLGLVVPASKALPEAVATLAAGLPRWRERVAAVDNRAVFEIPEIFASLLLASALPRAFASGAGGPPLQRSSERTPAAKPAKAAS